MKQGRGSSRILRQREERSGTTRPAGEGQSQAGQAPRAPASKCLPTNDGRTWILESVPGLSSLQTRYLGFLIRKRERRMSPLQKSLQDQRHHVCKSAFDIASAHQTFITVINHQAKLPLAIID